jgi:hypothetical protein
MKTFKAALILYVAEVTPENNDVSVSIAPVVKPQSKNRIYQIIVLKKTANP